MSQKQPKTDFIAPFRDTDEESIPFLQLLLTSPPKNAQTFRILLIYLGLTWISNWESFIIYFIIFIGEMEDEFDFVLMCPAFLDFLEKYIKP